MGSTLDLEDLLVSESLRVDVDADDRLSISGDPDQLVFDGEGALQPRIMSRRVGGS